MEQYTGTIYSLADKKGNVFYIGCTVLGLKTRLSQHISAAKSNSSFSKYACPESRREKIRSLNYEVVATVLETKLITAVNPRVASYDLGPIERKWIQEFLCLGYDLCNGGKNKVRNKKEYKKPDSIGDVYRTKKILP